MQPANKTIIKVHPPKICPKFTNIGYGNPRYNSMVVCPDETVIIPCGTSLRRVDIRSNQILGNWQIGCSQIMQIMENQRYVMVVNFQGLLTLLDKDSLKVWKSFRLGGKQIRHSSISKDFIAVSCQLNDDTKQARLQIYSIPDIQSKEGVQVKVQPVFSTIGHFYYPQIVQNQLVFIQFNDPNPKGRSRTETVMTKKQPIKHKILTINLKDFTKKAEVIYDIKYEGQILCAAHNKTTRQIFYLHQSKKLTILNLIQKKCIQLELKSSSAPHCIQQYKSGIIYGSQSSQLAHFEYSNEPVLNTIKTKARGLTTIYSMKKTASNNFIFFNENGLQYYDVTNEKAYTQNCFDITNCGVSFNADGTKFAVADFGGNVFVFSTQQQDLMPKPIAQVTIGIPVRTLVWVHQTNHIVVGCVGGYLYHWDGIGQEINLIKQTNDHTINIVRAFRNFIIFGTSDGFVHIMDANQLKELFKFQAHTPIHYQNQKDRELFGSMKNYAQIWSIIIFPTQKQNQFNLVTCSEDQTEKVFHLTISEQGQFNHKQNHHLVGHSLAVTSIDWKNMSKGLGPIYVSCSDDKIVRFRDPENMFEIIHELQTTTIKQWHTLTYLSLQPEGHRVAIGSQNGYLFIFDIHSKELLFGEKIHLGGVEGMDWTNGKLITCSSDLCISIINF